MGRKRQVVKDTRLGRYVEEWIDTHFDGSVDKLAQKSGVASTTINGWIRGAFGDQRISTLKLVADALGAPFEDICRAAVDLEPFWGDPAIANDMRRAVDALRTLRADDLRRAADDLEKGTPRDWRTRRGLDVQAPIPKSAVP